MNTAEMINELLQHVSADRISVASTIPESIVIALQKGTSKAKLSPVQKNAIALMHSDFQDCIQNNTVFEITGHYIDPLISTTNTTGETMSAKDDATTEGLTPTQMLQKMLEHTSKLRLSKLTGISNQTITKLSQSEPKRSTSADVVQRITTLYGEFITGTVTFVAGRKHKGGGEVPIPFSKRTTSSGSIFDRKALLKEKENLLAKLSVIEQALKYY